MITAGNVTQPSSISTSSSASSSKSSSTSTSTSNSMAVAAATATATLLSAPVEQTGDLSNRYHHHPFGLAKAPAERSPLDELHFGAKVALFLLSTTALLVVAATLFDLNLNWRRRARKRSLNALTSSSRQQQQQQQQQYLQFQLPSSHFHYQQQQVAASRSRDERSPSLSSTGSSSPFCSSNSVASASAPILGRQSNAANLYQTERQRLNESGLPETGAKGGQVKPHEDTLLAAVMRAERWRAKQQLPLAAGESAYPLQAIAMEEAAPMSSLRDRSEEVSLLEQVLLSFSLRHSAGIIFQDATKRQHVNHSRQQQVICCNQLSSPLLNGRQAARAVVVGVCGHRSRLASLSSINESRGANDDESEHGGSVEGGQVENRSLDMDEQSAASQFYYGAQQQLQHLVKSCTVSQEREKEKQQPQSIDSLHGLRFLSMIWIIVVHSYSLATRWSFFTNNSALDNIYKTAASQLISNGTFACDSFFFTGGFLLAYLAFPDDGSKQRQESFNASIGARRSPLIVRKTGSEKSIVKQASGAGEQPQADGAPECVCGSPNSRTTDNAFTFGRVLENLLHRYIRMMPLMMAVIGLSATLLRYLGEGPAWESSTMMFDKWCRKNWWINALFLHNFVNRENMCLSHSWYSAVDIQLFLVGQLVLFALYRNRYVGLLICFGLLLVAPLVTGALTLAHHLPAVPLMISSVSEQSLSLYYGEIYIKPYCRAAPYLIGILLAYLMRTTSLGQVRLKRVLVGWTSSLSCLLAILLATQPAMNGRPPGELASAFYSALSRPLWACATGWMIFACITKHGGPFESILSARCFVPLSRLTYPAFLIHPIVMAVFYGSRKESFSHYLMLYLILGHIVITYACAFVLSALFELPILSAERAIKRAYSSAK